MIPKVAIIILNWNGKEDTIECLESLKQITYPNYEILLVDNGSTDGSVECFRERYPGMEIIENEKNLGFAEGNNVGIRRAMELGADYVLLLNNDTVVDPEFLGELVKVAGGDEKIGIVGPKIYYYDYNGQKDVIWFAGGSINLTTGKTSHYNMKKKDDRTTNKIKKVDYITGCAILIKRDVIIKIGLLDSDYFLYFEEADLCTRANKTYDCVFVPDAKIWHKISSSTGGDFSSTMAYYFVRNRMLFMTKRESISTLKWILFLATYSGYSARKTVIFLLRGEIDLSKSVLRGYIDGLICFTKLF